jgi:hypothetical protein
MEQDKTKLGEPGSPQKPKLSPGSRHPTCLEFQRQLVPVEVVGLVLMGHELLVQQVPSTR